MRYVQVKAAVPQSNYRQGAVTDKKYSDKELTILHQDVSEINSKIISII